MDNDDFRSKDLSYFYQDGEKRRMILQDTSVKFEKGQFYTILGESGSGKTTFLSLISALDARQQVKFYIMVKISGTLVTIVFAETMSVLFFKITIWFLI